jgi:hypothetical protein
MTKNLLHISWTILFLAGFQFTFSQLPVFVKDSVDRRAILIGEPIQLTLEAQLPRGTVSSWFFTDSIPHFEFIEKGKIDSVATDEGNTFRQHIVITSFDSGSWVIPPIAILAGNKRYFTDSIPVNVDFSKFDPKQDYHDIKDILEVENPNARYIPWVLSGITLASLLLFLYFLTRKKLAPQTEQAPLSRLSPFEEAMRALEALRKLRLSETGQVKLFYTELNDIIRVFVLRKMQIASMERTNEELILQFRQLNLSNDQFSRLAQALRIIDFVKFAKYLPLEKDQLENFDIIRSSIEILNTLEK